MADNQNPDDEIFFEDIVKKTQTGVTLPKNLRDILFKENADIYFRLVIPKEKDKIILEILSPEKSSVMSLTLWETSRKQKDHMRKDMRLPSGQTRLDLNTTTWSALRISPTQ